MVSPGHAESTAKGWTTSFAVKWVFTSWVQYQNFVMNYLASSTLTQPLVVLELPIYNRWYAVEDVQQQTHVLFEMHSRNTSAAMSELFLGKMHELHGRSKLHVSCFYTWHAFIYDSRM